MVGTQSSVFTSQLVLQIIHTIPYQADAEARGRRERAEPRGRVGRVARPHAPRVGLGHARDRPHRVGVAPREQQRDRAVDVGRVAKRARHAQVDDDVIMGTIESADWSRSPSPARSDHVSEAALFESAVYESESDKEATGRDPENSLGDFRAVAAMVTHGQGVAEASPENGNERRTRQRVQPPSPLLAPPPGLDIGIEC